MLVGRLFHARATVTRNDRRVSVTWQSEWKYSASVGDAGECGYELEPVDEVGITYEQMRALIDSLLQQPDSDGQTGNSAITDHVPQTRYQTQRQSRPNSAGDSGVK